MADGAANTPEDEQPQPNEPVETPAPAPETPPEPQESRAEQRIQELSREVADARRLLNDAQRQQQELMVRQAVPAQAGRQHPVAGWQPDWEQFPGMVAIRDSLAQRDQQIQGLQQTTLAALNTLDKVQTPVELEDAYDGGRRLYRKYEGEVEQEFNQALQQGRPQSRKDLFVLVAARHGLSLKPRGSEPEAPEGRQARRGTSSATVEHAPPVRKVNSTPPAKSMHDMTPAERKQRLEGYVQERERLGLPL